MLKNKRGIIDFVMDRVIGVILLLSVLLTIVLQQVSAVNTTALGTAGTAILNILGLFVVLNVLIFLAGGWKRD